MRPYKTEKPLAVGDCETTPNYFALGMREIAGQKRTRVFELSDRSTIDWDLVDRIMRSHTVIGYNWHSFDKLLLRWAVEHPDCTPEQLKAVAQILIGERVKWWDAEKRLNITLPHSWDSIDLIEPQPNPFASLKVLNARLHGRWLQELPYGHMLHLTHEQMDETNTYMVNDLDATELLWDALRESMALRETMGKTVKADMRSKSDTQMGLAIIKHRVEKELGRRLPRVDYTRPQPFRYTPPSYIRFETPVLRAMLAKIAQHEFVVDSGGKVELPDFLTVPFVLDGTEYAMGIGGLHTTESSRSLREDSFRVLVDADVASYYPRIILSLGLVPAAIGPVFLKVYEEILNDRLAAKKKQKGIKARMALPECQEITALALELAMQQAIDGGLKIAANGTFGTLGSTYSIIYAPHLMIAITITGQSALLMLIERANALGIGVVSANTDGVLFHCPREEFDGIDGVRLKGDGLLAEVTEHWEQETGFNLEFAQYSAIFNHNVNSYIAIKSTGGHKRNGPLANPWNSHPDDWNPRKAMTKNPQSTICSDAVLALVKDGIPIETTIRSCRDIRKFVTVIKVTKGGTWGPPVEVRPGEQRYLGKVVRYYYAADGAPIYEAEGSSITGNFKQVAKTEGCRPIMTFDPAPEGSEHPWALPDDIDFSRYIAEARQMLRDIGGFGRIAVVKKAGNLARVRKDLLRLWAQAI